MKASEFSESVLRAEVRNEILTVCENGGWSVDELLEGDVRELAWIITESIAGRIGVDVDVIRHEVFRLVELPNITD